MAKKEAQAKVKIKVDDGGSIKATRKDMQGLASDTSRVTNANKGVAGTSGKAGKDFARQASGMGGLVAAYATVAANVFALSAAFQVLKNAADFDSMIVSSNNLAAATGNNFIGIAASVQRATGNQLDFADSLAVTNKAVASGIGADQLAEFTDLATKAAQTFGGTTRDALNRMTDAVLRGRTELVNKLGIVISADEAYSNYGASINKSAQELSSFEKRQAITNAIIQEGNKAIGQTVIDTNPLELLAVTFKDLGQDLLTYATNTEGFLTSILNLFNQSKVAVGGLAAVALGSVLSKLKTSDAELRKRAKVAKTQAEDEKDLVTRRNKVFRRQRERALSANLRVEEDFSRKRLKVFADEAEKATTIKLRGRLKSFDAAMDGKTLSERQISGAHRALNNADLNKGALAEVPKKIREDFRKQLKYMSGDVKSLELDWQKRWSSISTQFKVTVANAKVMRSNIRLTLKGMVVDYHNAAAQISSKGLFTKLPANMSLVAKGAARLSGAFSKLMGSLGTIGMVVAIATSAWEWYSKTFREHENRITKINALTDELKERQKSLLTTLESSGKVFDSLLSDDTTASYAKKTTIIVNNMASIIAKMKEARLEISKTTDASSQKLVIQAEETRLKALKKERVELAKYVQNFEKTSRSYKGPSGGEVTLVEDSAIDKLDSKIKASEKLLKDLGSDLSDTYDAATNTLKSGIGQSVQEIDLFFKNISKNKVKTPLAKEALDQITEIKTKLLELSNTKFELGEAGYDKASKDTDALVKRFGQLKTRIEGINSSIEEGQKRTTDTLVGFRGKMLGFELLPKALQNVMDNIGSPDMQKQFTNFRDSITGVIDEVTGEVKQSKLLQDSPASVDFLAKVLGVDPKENSTLDLLNLYLDKMKNIKQEAGNLHNIQNDLKNLEGQVAQVDTRKVGTTGERQLLDLEAERLSLLDKINNKKLALLDTQIHLTYSTLTAAKGDKDAVARIKQQLKVLKAKRVLLLNNKAVQEGEKRLREGNQKLDVKELTHAKTIFNLAKQKMDLESSLVETQANGVKILIDQEKRSKARKDLLAKEINLHLDIAKAKTLGSKEEMDRELQKLGILEEKLKLEKEILDLKHQQDFRGRASDLQQTATSKEDVAEALALSLQADLIDAVNEANQSINKLATGFASSIRAGISSLMGSIMEGNFKVGEAIGAMADVISTTLVETATDQLTNWILGMFKVEDTATRQRTTMLETQRSMDNSLRTLANRDLETGATGTATKGEGGFMDGILNFVSDLFGFGPKPSTESAEGTIPKDTSTKMVADPKLLTGQENLVASMGAQTLVSQEGTVALLTQTAQSLMNSITNATSSTALVTSNMALTSAILANTLALSASQATSTLQSVGSGIFSTAGGTALANGGIVRQDTPYMIGEGRKNEAVVPLPNNKEIPVVLSGDGGGDTYVSNYDFSGADAATEARIRMMIEANGAKTFNKVFTEIDRGGQYAKRTGRRS